MADPSPTDPAEAPPGDQLAAVRAGIVLLESVADLFASFAMQANRLAGVLEASITNPDDPTLVDPYATTWPNPEAARAARSEWEAAEIERRIAADDRTEVIRIGSTEVTEAQLRAAPAHGIDALRFPKP